VLLTRRWISRIPMPPIVFIPMMIVVVDLICIGKHQVQPAEAKTM
jgi:hypothetical protein